MPAKAYIKHLIECNCILPQFIKIHPTIFHKFVVFSELDENGDIIPSYVQCSNCNAVHKIIEVWKSKTIAKESIGALPNINDIKISIPTKYAEILEQYKCELYTWQETNFILEHEMWGTPIILKKEEIDGTISGKYIMPISKDLLKIDNFLDERENNE